MGFNSKNQARPDLASLMDEARRDTQLSINCHQIGTIQEFDPATQLATIKLAIKQVSKIDDDGTKTITEYPLLMQCPVIVLFGGVDVLTFPIAVGDSCLVLFNDRQIDNWLNSGDGATPSISRVHDLSDGIAIVGIRPLTNSIANYLANGIRLSHGGGNAQVDLTDNLITSIATLFVHNGSMRVTEDLQVEGNMTVLGDVYGNGTADINLNANILQESGKSIHAGNGASGTFDSVTVVDGIVTGGTT